MKKSSVFRINDLLGLLNTLYPPALAEDWDNPGLQVGDGLTPVQRILICLDPTIEVLSEAAARGADCVISHHPLIFRPLKSLNPADPAAAPVLQAIRNGIAVISAHTNLDSAADGLNDWLAARLGITASAPLRSSAAPLFKLVVTVPQSAAEAVREALFAGGAGRLGNYDRCSFFSSGTGTFRPDDAARPFIGTSGEESRVDEVRIEALVPAELIRKTLDKLRRAHPYEEPAIDLIPLNNRRPDCGLGRIGRLAAPLSLADYAQQVKTALGLVHLRLVGDPQRPVSKVAVCGGSGASLILEAQRQGADLLVTGDIKYHEAQSARAIGLALLDAGHFATEQLMVAELGSRLQQAFTGRGQQIEVLQATSEQDLFTII